MIENKLLTHSYRICGRMDRWEACSATCGPGARRRNRECIGSSFCNEKLEDFEECNDKVCSGKYSMA